MQGHIEYDYNPGMPTALPSPPHLPPLPDRPLIRLEEISAMLKVPTERLRLLCQPSKWHDFDIPIVTHPTYGELLSVTSTQRLLERVIEQRAAERRRSAVKQDRIGLLLWMCGLDQVLRRKPRDYADDLESEVNRIAKLKDPARTIQAVRLLSRFVDARKIAVALRRTEMPVDVAKVQDRLEEMSGGRV